MTNRAMTLKPFAPALLITFALLLLPAAASAQAARHGAAADAPSRLVGHVELGGAFGLAIPFESGLDTGFKLNGNAFLGVQQLTPSAVLQLGGNLAWTYNGHSGGFGGSLNAVDFLPTLRLRTALSPLVFAYGDVGVGLSVVSESVDIPGLGTVSNTDTAFLLKLGGGLGYTVSPQLALTFEPAFNIYAKDGSVTQFTLMFGVLYRP